MPIARSLNSANCVMVTMEGMEVLDWPVFERPAFNINCRTLISTLIKWNTIHIIVYICNHI